MNNFKEVNLIISYDEFKHWRARCPIQKRIPDNQLARVLIHSCFSHRCNNENKIELIHNNILSTDLPDYDEYQDMNKRIELYQWLHEGVDLYDHVFTSYALMFSFVTHVYVESIEEEGIIKAIIAGRGINYEKNCNGFSKYNPMYRSAIC